MKSVPPGTIRYLIEKRVEIEGNKEDLLERPDEVSQWLALENERMAGRSLYK